MMAVYASLNTQDTFLSQGSNYLDELRFCETQKNQIHKKKQLAQDMSTINITNGHFFWGGFSQHKSYTCIIQKAYVAYLLNSKFGNIILVFDRAFQKLQCKCNTCIVAFCS